MINMWKYCLKVEGRSSNTCRRLFTHCTSDTFSCIRKLIWLSSPELEVRMAMRNTFAAAVYSHAFEKIMSPQVMKEVRIFLFGAVRTVHTAPWRHYQNKNVSSNRLYWTYDSPQPGIVWQTVADYTSGPAAAKVLSPKRLRVRLTTNVRRRPGNPGHCWTRTGRRESQSWTRRAAAHSGSQCSRRSTGEIMIASSRASHEPGGSVLN